MTSTEKSCMAYMFKAGGSLPLKAVLHPHEEKKCRKRVRFSGVGAERVYCEKGVQIVKYWKKGYLNCCDQSTSCLIIRG